MQKLHRSRIKPISKAREVLLREYRKKRRIFLAANPWCVVFADKRATDVHHVCGRTGAMLLDTRFWLPVSRKGHNWIHSNIEKAREFGYLPEKGKPWNTPDTDWLKTFHSFGTGRP